MEIKFLKYASKMFKDLLLLVHCWQQGNPMFWCFTTVDSFEITKLGKSLFLLTNTPCKYRIKPFLSCLDYWLWKAFAVDLLTLFLSCFFVQFFPCMDMERLPYLAPSEWKKFHAIFTSRRPFQLSKHFIPFMNKKQHVLEPWLQVLTLI